MTTQPASQTIDAGHSVEFSAAASGIPAPTVQWQTGSEGSGWADVTGATAPALSVTAATSDSGKQYRAVFTNPAGSATSNAATLTVNAPTTTPPTATPPTTTSTTAGIGLSPASPVVTSQDAPVQAETAPPIYADAGNTFASTGGSAAPAGEDFVDTTQRPSGSSVTVQRRPCTFPGATYNWWITIPVYFGTILVDYADDVSASAVTSQPSVTFQVPQQSDFVRTTPDFPQAQVQLPALFYVVSTCGGAPAGSPFQRNSADLNLALYDAGGGGGGGGGGTPSPPTAAFSSSVTRDPGNPPGAINPGAYRAAFVSTVTDSALPSGPFSYAWTFGDGGTSTEANPTHEYTHAGTFPVSLSVTDTNGNVQVNHSVVAANQAPLARFVVTRVRSGSCNDLFVNPSGSTDDSRIVGYHTVATRQGASFGEAPLVADGLAPVFSCVPFGNYTVTLSVTDDDGVTSTATQSVTLGGLTTTMQTSPSPLELGGLTRVVVQATNNTGHALTFAASGFNTSGGPGRVSIEKIQKPASGVFSGFVPIGPGQTVEWTYTLLGEAPGPVQVRAQASATDTVDNTTVTSDPVATTITVNPGATLTATAARHASAYGQQGDQNLPLKGLAPGDVLTYHGTHWNPLGGPIEIKSADTVIKTIPAIDAFNDNYTFPGFKPKAPHPCASDLTATQDSTTRTIALGSDPGEKVLFVDGITLADGTTPTAGDVLCQGWNLGAHRTGHWTLVTDVTGGRIVPSSPGAPPWAQSQPDGGLLANPPAGVWVQQGDGATTTIDVPGVLGPISFKAGDGHTVHLAGDPAPPGDPFQRSPIATQPGNQVQNLSGGTNSSALEGYNQVDKNITLTHLGGTFVLAAHHSVTVKGPSDATNVGIFADGPVTFTGPVSGNLDITADGPVVFEASHGTTSVQFVADGLLFPSPTSAHNPGYTIASTRGTYFGVNP